MSNKTQLQTNNASLDEFITRINAAKEVAAGLPEAGSGGTSNIVSITVDNQSGAALYYFNADKIRSEVPSDNGITTINALGGLVYYRQQSATECSGDYISTLNLDTFIAVFLSDGGTIACCNPGGGID